MSVSFAIIAIVIVGAGAAAMSLRNLVHCALAISVAFVGLAAAYLQLSAQFVGFAQILVYVGAVAILVVFAILLTRGGDSAEQSIFSSSWLSGLAVAIAVLAVLLRLVMKSSVIQREIPAQPDVTVRQLGETLMNRFVLPLEVIGLLLTAALIGAVIIAMQERRTGTETKPGEEGGAANRQAPTAHHP